MTASTQEEQRARIDEEASMWLEKLERTITVDESRALREWLRCAAHRQIIVERCKLWHGPEILAVLSKLVPVTSLSQRIERQYGRIVLGIFLGVSGIGFATVVIAVSKIWPGRDELGNPLRAEASAHTAIGERKTLALPDGGSIVLNTTTHLLLSYGPHSRDVTLLRGEAMFDAKDDPARPFRVFAGTRRFMVETGGARFNVRRYSRERIELAVLSGRVSAAPSRSAGPLPPALLRAGVSSGAHVFNPSEGGMLGTGWQSTWSLPPHEMRKRTAWQTGVMIFEKEPLDDAVHEIERYSTTHFAFASDELRGIRLSGEFGTGDVEGVLRHLYQRFKIDARRKADGTIVLVSAAKRSSCVPGCGLLELLPLS